jgi:hypothetical protein
MTNTGSVLPVEFDTLVTQVDLANGPRSPFTLGTHPNGVVEASAPGVRLRGTDKPDWVQSFGLGNYALRDFGMKVVCRMEGAPNGAMRIWFRNFWINGMGLGYTLSIRPLLRQYRLVRYAGNETDPIVDWAEHGSIVGPFDRNVVELAVRDDKIMAAINRQSVVMVQDASFGRGQISVGGLGPTPNDAVVIEYVDLWTVCA